jgi:hypothetical protein
LGFEGRIKTERTVSILVSILPALVAGAVSAASTIAHTINGKTVIVFLQKFFMCRFI